MRKFLLTWLWRRGVLGRFAVVLYVAKFIYRMVRGRQAPRRQPKKGSDRQYDYEVK